MFTNSTNNLHPNLIWILAFVCDFDHFDLHVKSPRLIKI